MELVYFLLPAALILAMAGLFGFIWAVRSGQFKDLDTPSRRILFEDDAAAKSNNNSKSQ